MRVKRTGQGGPRPGSGRPRGPVADVRRNRVVVMLTDAELAKLHRMAEERALPFGTVAYEIVARALARREQFLASRGRHGENREEEVTEASHERSDSQRAEA